MTKKAQKQRARNKRLQKKRQRRRNAPSSRPGFVIEVQNGTRYYDLLLTDPECEALRAFASSTLDVTGEVLAGKPEFVSASAQRAFQGIARKGLVKPEPPREDGFWALTDLGLTVADALGVEPPKAVDTSTPGANRPGAAA